LAIPDHFAANESADQFESQSNEITAEQDILFQESASRALDPRGVAVWPLVLHIRDQ
jgi:hypothetical protein